jgi:hypothetical protein
MMVALRDTEDSTSLLFFDFTLREALSHQALAEIASMLASSIP